MPPRPRRFYSLDVLRGLAALTVVFWHWRHFFQAGFRPLTARIGLMPFYRPFSLFYDAGWIAVDLFFLLSGFVFFWLYSAPVRERQVSAREFAVLRFSRLYPLHLATLVAVTIGQVAFRHVTGHDFVYDASSLTQFVLNLCLMSGWGPVRAPSFNAPVWSVSLEVGLYAIFFMLCRLTRPRLVVILPLSALGFMLVNGGEYQLVGRGIGGFFFGGGVYLVYDWIVRKDLDRVLAPLLLTVAAAAWIAVFLPGSLARQSVASWRASHIRDYWPAALVLFPLTILALVLVETRRGTLGRRVAFIGDLSYASYLLHFPLQLAIATMVVWFGFDQLVLFTPAFFVWFFLVVIGTSLASYVWFEAPAQRWLRGKYGHKKRPVANATGLLRR